MKPNIILNYLMQFSIRKNDPEFRRIQFIRSSSLILALPLLIYAVYNTLISNVLFTITFGSSAILLFIVNLMLARPNTLRKVSRFIVVCIYFLTFICLFWGESQYYSLIWMVCAPTSTYYLIGSKKGLKINIGFLLFLFVFLLTRSRDLIPYRSLVNIMFCMVFLCLTLYSYEKSRELYQASLEEKQRQLERISNIDSLTGLYNRTRIDQIIEANFCKFTASESDTPNQWCLILIDIDCFKKINDTYGHQEGDRALKAVATALLDNIRSSGVVARWGGEEFLVFLSGISPVKIIELAESTKLCIEHMKFDNGLKITVSMGLTFYRNGDTYDTFLKRADDGLYKAKAQGRNRIEIVHL
ncbi:GGDEF domain-containing protein [Oscillospiraceae bacterium PP1C4]